MLLLIGGIAVLPAAGAGYLAMTATGTSIAGLEWLLVFAAPIVGWVGGYIALLTVFSLVMTLLFETIDNRHAKQAIETLLSSETAAPRRAA